MNEAILLALLILALAGWSACLVLFARSLLPMANAFKVLHVVDKTFDDRINAVLDRARANTKKPVIPGDKPQAQAPTPFINPLADMFPGAGPLISPAMGLEDQPDSDLEMVQA